MERQGKPDLLPLFATRWALRWPQAVPYPHFGLVPGPVIAGAAMRLSSVSVPRSGSIHEGGEPGYPQALPCCLGLRPWSIPGENAGSLFNQSRQCALAYGPVSMQGASSRRRIEKLCRRDAALHAHGRRARSMQGGSMPTIRSFGSTFSRFIGELIDFLRGDRVAPRREAFVHGSLITRKAGYDFERVQSRRHAAFDPALAVADAPGDQDHRIGFATSISFARRFPLRRGTGSSIPPPRAHGECVIQRAHHANVIYRAQRRMDSNQMSS